MNLIIKLIFNSVALFLTSLIVPGFYILNFWVAIIAAVLLAIVNVIIRPIMLFITIPINIITLGLFTFVINALMLWIVSSLVSGFVITSVFSAIIGAVVLTAISTLLHLILEKSENGRYGKQYLRG